MKNISYYATVFVLVSTLSACSSGLSAASSLVGSTQNLETINEEIVTEALGNTAAISYDDSLDVGYDVDDIEVNYDRADMSEIVFEGDSIAFTGDRATVDGSTITIRRAGSYQAIGILNDGQLIVDTQDEDTVFLLLNGVDLRSSGSAPIYVRNAEKVVITLVDGTENFVTDAETYVFADQEDEPNAAIFSNDDLTFNGGGSLVVYANYRNGIVSDDDLKIVSGAITVYAVGDGIKGRDSVAIREGTITITAGADALQADNDEDPEKGYILIEGGYLDLEAGLDGVQAETRLVIQNGEISITSGGGAPDTVANNDRGMPGGFNTQQTDESTKGLKAGVDLTIASGSIQVDALDDALHSNGSMTIAGGTLMLATGDDGLHAETTLTVQGGDLTITKSYEGIESADIVIQNGTIHVVASDDGLNGSSGNGGEMAGGRPAGGFFEAGDNSLVIEGGYLVVDAMGDGLDINGPISMSGGVVIVVGPTSNNNGALDYSGSFDVSGGLLIAVGSSGMAQAPSDASSQYSLMYNYTSTQPAGTLFHIEAENGQEILTFAPWREYASVVFSSPELESGGSYSIFSGGDSTGSINNGLYLEGTYSAGQQITSFTISSTVTMIGAGGGGMRGGPGGDRGGQPPIRQQEQ
jgi:hypothetical protein